MKLLPLLLAPVVAAFGAQVSGRIQYSPERPLPGANVTLTNEETGIRRVAWSNAEGYYSIAGVQPGVYKMIVRMDGFQSVARTGIRLEVEELARIDLTMRLGRLDQSIVVESGVSFLETENSGVSTVANQDPTVRQLGGYKRISLGLAHAAD
jgi:hypothetical protein